MSLNAEVLGLRAEAETTLTDTGTITRDADGALDADFDEGTLSYVTLGADPSTVYSGACSVSPLAIRGTGSVDENGQDLYDHDYTLRIPITEPIPQVGDVFTWDTPSVDDSEAGSTFRIVEVKGSSRGVLRRCRMTRRTRGPRL